MPPADARPPAWLDLPADHPFGVANLPYGVFSTRRHRAPGRRADRRPGARRRRGRPDRRDAVGVGDGPDLTAAWAQPEPQRLPRAGPPGLDRRPRLADRVLTDDVHAEGVRPHLRAARRRHAAPADRGRRLRRLLRQRAPRHQRRPHLPARLRAADPELEAPADRLPRPLRAPSSSPAPTSSGRSGQRKAPSDPAPTFGPSRKLDIEAELGLRRGRRHRRSASRSTSTTPRTTSSASSCSTTGAPATSRPGSTCRSGPFLGKSFAHLDLAWVTPMEALARRHVAAARPGPRAAPLPARRRRRGVRARPAPRGGLERHRRRPPGVPRHVLVAGPDAGAPDRQRRVDPQRRPVRLGHHLAAPRRTPAAASSSSSGTAPSRSPSTTAASAPSSRTATRSCCARGPPGTDGARLGLGEVSGTILPAR